jgi:hypothetical protein
MIFCVIATYCSPRTILSLLQLSKYYHNLLDDENQWRDATLIHYPYCQSESSSWKKLYVSLYQPKFCTQYYLNNKLYSSKDHSIVLKNNGKSVTLSSDPDTLMDLYGFSLVHVSSPIPRSGTTQIDFKMHNFPSDILSTNCSIVFGIVEEGILIEQSRYCTRMYVGEITHSMENIGYATNGYLSRREEFGEYVSGYVSGDRVVSILIDANNSDTETYGTCYFMLDGTRVAKPQTGIFTSTNKQLYFCVSISHTCRDIVDVTIQRVVYSE